MMRRPEHDRYPPLPRQAGFNVFGPLRSVLFRGVHGHLSIGDKAKNLSGSDDLQLTDVSGLQNKEGEAFVPAPLTTGAESAALQFRAVGEVSINEIPQTETTLMEESHNLFAALSFAFGLLGAFFGLRTYGREVSESEPVPSGEAPSN